MSADNVVAVTSEATRSAAREAAFKYTDKLCAIATAMRTNKALTVRRLCLMFYAAEHELLNYAKALDESPRNRVLAECLRRYAAKLKLIGRRPVTADELEAEAKTEMDNHLTGSER